MERPFLQSFLPFALADSALHWQMADERGSWEERVNDNRWGWGGEEKQKGTGVNWGNRKGEETYI